MDRPDTPATDAAPADGADARDEGGRFRPGLSGDPQGRPPGSSRALHLAGALVEVGVVAWCWNGDACEPEPSPSPTTRPIRGSPTRSWPTCGASRPRGGR